VVSRTRGAARHATFAGTRGRGICWGFVALLAVAQVYGNFGPPPSSPENMGMTALFFYALLALLAGLVERAAVRT
jgi:hypothetical protein